MSDVKVMCAHDEMVSLVKLVPNPRNPNTHPKTQIVMLARIIEAQGWRAPITVSTRSGFIVRGHGRYMAAQKLGVESAPVDYQDYESEAEEWADLIADNRLSELSEIDEKALASLLSALDAMDFDMELTGFDDKALEALLKDLDGDEQEATEPSRIIKSASLEELAPTDEERAALAGRRFLVEFSGGKDSSAASLWIRHYFPEAPVELVFVDMGADFIGFLPFLQRFAEFTGYKLTILRSAVTMFEAFAAKGDWPIFVHPYCHDVLHETLDEHFESFPKDEITVVRGGRLAEKAKAGKTNDSRFLTIERLDGYQFFQPLYFGAKEVSESILKEAGAPVWQGYEYGLQRTACRICPGQKPRAYAAIRANYPEVWNELLTLEAKFGPGCWQAREEGEAKTFTEMADKGHEKFEEGNYLRMHGMPF